MSNTLDPATMDALNALGDEIEAGAQANAEAAQEPASGATIGDTGQVEEPVAEAPEATEAASEDETGEPDAGTEGEQPTAEKKPRATGADKRIKELTREKYEARHRAEVAAAEAEALRRELEAIRAQARTQQPVASQDGQPVPVAPPVVQRAGESGVDFEARVQAEAARRAEQAAFNDACNRVAAKGQESYKDFKDAQTALMGAFGRQVTARPEFLQAIIKLPNGHDVFHHLGTNLDAAEEIFAHSSSVDLVLAMKDLAGKISTPKAQAVSKAPAPVTPIRGGSTNRGAVRLDDEKADANEWSREFLKSMAG